MNQASTRSHCIFTIHLMSKEVGSATVRRSKLHLVDLAGYVIALFTFGEFLYMTFWTCDMLSVSDNKCCWLVIQCFIYYYASVADFGSE